MGEAFPVGDDRGLDVPDADAVDVDVADLDPFREEAGAGVVDDEARAVFEEEDGVMGEAEAHREGDLGIGEHVLEEALGRDVVLRLQKGDDRLEVLFGSVHP